ncbi:DOMON domain-containing protein frrs1L [Sorochytrium milnesiophthora]
MVPLSLLSWTLVVANIASLLAATDPSQFRSFDGTQNNPSNSSIGSVGTPFSHKVADAPTNLTLQAIADLRIISNVLAAASPADTPSKRLISQFHSAWGSFIAQDLWSIVASEAPGDQLDVPVPQNDTSLTPGSKIAVSRAHATKTGNSRVPLNLATHFLDGSHIYGITPDQVAALRDGAYMKLDAATKLPPTAADNPKATNTSQIPTGIDSKNVFALGAMLGNSWTSTQALYILFLREHNRYVDVLKGQDKTLSDEQLYQRARNYVIALLQHFTYYEYLPLLLGRPLAPYTGYNASVRPDIDTFFASVAFRYMNSEFGSSLTVIDSTTSKRVVTLDGSQSFSTDLIRQSDIAPVLSGLASTLAQDAQVRYADTLRTETIGNGHSDAFVRDLFRARDFGVADFAKASLAFDVAAPASLANFSSAQAASALPQLYQSLDRVDALVGGLLEDRNITQTTLSPLLNASVYDQFTRLRTGDRYWHENPGVLTADELLSIKGTPFRNFILRNMGSSTADANAILPKNMWQVVPESTVTPEKPSNFTFGVLLDSNFFVSWSLENRGQPNGIARFLVSCGYRGWCAFGFGDSMLTATEMYVSRILPDGQNATTLEYHPPAAYGPPNRVNSSILTIVRSQVNASGFEVEFTRPLAAGNGHADIADQPLNMIYAYQPIADGAMWFTFHSENRGTLQLNLATGVTSQKQTKKLGIKLLIHGICMITVWGLISPTGIFIARYLRTHNGWISSHAGVQTLAGSVAILAAGLAISATRLGNSAHGLFGFSIFIVLIIQMSAGFLNLRRLLGATADTSSSVLSMVNRWFHLYTGRILFLATLANMPLGIQYAFPFDENPFHPFWIAYFCALAFWITLYAVFEVRRVMREDRGDLYDPVAGVDSLAVDVGESKKGKTGRLNTKKAAMQRMNDLGASADPRLAGVPAMTWSDVAREVEDGAMWVVGNGYVYDVSKWIGSHPGGQQVLQAAIGTDVSTDFFNNVLYDQKHFKPYAAIPDSTPGSTKGTAPGRGVSTMTSSTMGFANRDLAADMRVTAEDWKRVLSTRRQHFHSRSAIAKLQTLVVGRLETNGVNKYQRDEYRRYALTAKEQISAAGADAPVYKLRFCLLYPNEAYDEEPLFFLPGQAVQLQVRHGGKLVSRYFTPINGNMTMFEAIVKCLPRGEMSALLRAASVGRSAYKIRGPYGSPLINPARALPHGNGCWDNVVCIGVGSGITPFLQLTSWYFLQTTFSLTCRPNTPTHSNELAVSAGEKVFIKYPMENGWVYGQNSATSEEGFVRLSMLMPWIGRAPRMVVANVASGPESLIGNDTLLTVSKAYPEQYRLLNLFTRGGQPVDPEIETAFGRVDERYIDDLLRRYWMPNANNMVLICGPEGFLETTHDALVRFGVPEESVISLPPYSYLVSTSLQWSQTYAGAADSTETLASPGYGQDDFRPLDLAEPAYLGQGKRPASYRPLTESLILPSIPLHSNPHNNEPEWYYLPSGDEDARTLPYKG